MLSKVVNILASVHNMNHQIVAVHYVDTLAFLILNAKNLVTACKRCNKAMVNFIMPFSYFNYYSLSK